MIRILTETFGYIDCHDIVEVFEKFDPAQIILLSIGENFTLVGSKRIEQLYLDFIDLGIISVPQSNDHILDVVILHEFDAWDPRPKYKKYTAYLKCGRPLHLFSFSRKEIVDDVYAAVSPYNVKFEFKE